MFLVQFKHLEKGLESLKANMALLLKWRLQSLTPSSLHPF
jgi:hypothetical protein